MPPARTRTRSADPDLRDAWWRALRRANLQALTDLHACDGAEVVFV
jgi:hypothetical protein